jgi:hypothetical protein
MRPYHIFFFLGACGENTDIQRDTRQRTGAIKALLGAIKALLDAIKALLGAIKALLRLY